MKDKLGNRSNASSEVEFDGTLAWMVGPEGRGVATIAQMVNATRLDCVIGSACGMRQGVVQAIHHASHRSAFGRTLVDQPLMANVLADLAIESQAATLLAMRLAHAVDAGETALRRLGTAIAKYHVCKTAPRHAAEALECLGGAGYVEESGLPRLYREAPLNGIWEGSGNVNALDVLRAMAREPQSLEALRAEIGTAAGADRSARYRHGRTREVARRRRRNAARGGWSSGCARCSPARCSFGTRRRRSPTPIARPGSAAIGVRRTARCRPASTPQRSLLRRLPLPEPFPLRDDRVLRIAGRRLTGLEDGEPFAARTRQ